MLLLWHKMLQQQTAIGADHARNAEKEAASCCCSNKFHVWEKALAALSTVLLSSMTMVMGPTPPGTGEMKAAFLLTSAKSTSPTSRYPLFLVGSCRGIQKSLLCTMVRNGKSTVKCSIRALPVINAVAPLTKLNSTTFSLHQRIIRRDQNHKSDTAGCGKQKSTTVGDHHNGTSLAIGYFVHVYNTCDN